MSEGFDLSDFAMLDVSAEAIELLEDRSKAGKAVPLFVYGTLRTDEGLFPHYLVHAVKIRTEATTSGTLYFPGHRSFPGADFHTEAEVPMVGDLAWLALEDPNLRDVIWMELRAGYSLAVVEATYERKTGRPHRKTINALAFQYEYLGRAGLRPVPGNDWKCAAARKARRA